MTFTQRGGGPEKIERRGDGTVLYLAARIDCLDQPAARAASLIAGIFMTLTTQRDLIRAVAWRWESMIQNRFLADQIIPRGKDFPGTKKTAAAIAEELRQLDKETASREDVDFIIGNSSWTTLWCDECRQEVGAVVRLGESDEERRMNVCPACILQAANVAREAIYGSGSSMGSVPAGSAGSCSGGSHPGGQHPAPCEPGPLSS